MILIILILAKTGLKVIKVSCCRLINLYRLNALHHCMSRSRPLGYVGSVLLSVVAQVLLCNFLCAGFFLSPSFDDADDGNQWDVQTSEGWTPYWDPLQV
jgi:hypothetical protein